MRKLDFHLKINLEIKTGSLEFVKSGETYYFTIEHQQKPEITVVYLTKKDLSTFSETLKFAGRISLFAVVGSVVDCVLNLEKYTEELY